MKRLYVTLFGFCAVAGIASAQQLQSGYVTSPESTKLHTYISAWNGGQGQITINGSTWEDEEFFTSRVKPRQRVVRDNGDIYNYSSAKDKRVLWWCPIGNPGTWAIPNAVFDGEVFSMWSYIDYYGNFSAPYGWSDGALADIAHKNGVAVSGQASVPNAAISGDWQTCLSSMGSTFNTQQKAEDLVGKFLLYHGCDGLAYNSEFSGGSSIVPNLTTLHGRLNSWMASRNPVFENIWYDGTNDSGSIGFDSFLSGKTGIFANSSIFSNYNYNSSSLDNVPARAAEARDNQERASFYFYAGNNMQGGEPHSYAGAYTRLANTAVSLGYWGAHESNMFWEGRGAGGTSDLARQQYYLNKCETFFSNGQRNPAVRLPIIDNKGHRPSENWTGISYFRNAATTINHNIANEAFYSFFNLGNGTFFNWKGERVSNNDWYSIGIQDYMPTWRFWIAPAFMQTTVTKGSQGLQADFTWEDAYVGGSCLKISGTATEEYIHLFKSAIQLTTNAKVVVRYRLLNGEATVNLIGSTPGAPAAKKSLGANVLTLKGSADAVDQCYDINSPDRWITKVYNISSMNIGKWNDGGGLGTIALEIKNAKNLELLIGEIGIYPGSSNDANESVIIPSTTPSAPQLTTTKILANNYIGIDAKLIWTMDGGKGRAAGTPVYNSDVNTSMFKMYCQEEGGEEVFMGVTTSWAGIVFKCPTTDNSKKIRFGVRAVSADTRSESSISWSQYMTKPAYTTSDEISLNKKVIKANESFEFGYVDPQHSSSIWRLVDSEGNTVLQETGVRISVPEGLPEEGGYDLYIDPGTDNERVFGYYVQVSGPQVGALPEIYDIARDGNTVTESDFANPVNIQLSTRPVLSYTGRAADGNASRAVRLNGRYLGAKVGDLGIKSGQSFSVAGWFKFDEIPSAQWNFMNLSNKLGSWPINTWGWAWNYGEADGSIHCRFRGNTDGADPGEVHYDYPDLRVQAGSWTHIAWVCEYSTSNGFTGFRSQLYINGVLQNSIVKAHVGGNGTYKTTNGVSYNWIDGNTPVWGQTYAITDADYIYFGGAAHKGAAIDGIVDDFQVWNKAMTQEDVANSMSGFVNGLPSGVLCMWDFESDTDANNYFLSRGSKTNVKASSYELAESSNEGAGSGYLPMTPAFTSGCPFLAGTAFAIDTKATWTDNFRATQFLTSVTGATEGEGGQATVSFADEGDHNVTLTLENMYGKDTREFPVFAVGELAAIDGIDADGDNFEAYTEGNVLFLEFAADGAYDVQVYNVSGMAVASETLNAVAGQSAQVTLGVAGVYLVKVVKDGKVLRTVKVLSK